MKLNKTQIQATLAPIVGILVSWLAHKFPLLDMETWNTLVNAVVFAGISAFIGWRTTRLSLKDEVGSMPYTTVVTDKASANALPNNPDVIAVTPQIVASIKQAS